ncbi:MAG: DMT family transporter [bacterium]|nr:DMT family transporter [bacterium]MDE0437577.1 DMT family transporter [bacterium]
MSHPSPASGRQPLPATARGSRLGDFGPVEWVLLVASALTWGSSFLLIEISLESVAPPTITWVRITLGFLVLTLVPAARRPVDRADYLRVALLGLTWLAVPFSIFPIAQQYIDSALAGMLVAMVPIFTTLIAMVLMRSLPRFRQAAGITLGFVGAVSIGLPAARGSSAAAAGVMLVVLATIFHGISLNVAVPLQQRYGAPAVMMRAIGVAALATAPLGLAGLAGSQWGTAPVLAVIVLGVSNTGAAFVLMTAFLGRVGSTRGGVAVYLVPVIAIVLGMVFRSEVVLPLQWAGTAVVLFGAWLTSRRES